MRNKKNGSHSVYKFNIFDLEFKKEEKKEEEPSPTPNPPRIRRHISKYIKKLRNESLPSNFLETKKKLAHLYELYERCYFLYMFKLDPKAFNNVLKNIDIGHYKTVTLEDLICICDGERLVEIKDSWIFSLDKRIELHEKLFKFLKSMETIQKEY